MAPDRWELRDGETRWNNCFCSPSSPRSLSCRNLPLHKKSQIAPPRWVWDFYVYRSPEREIMLGLVCSSARMEVCCTLEPELKAPHTRKPRRIEPPAGPRTSSPRIYEASHPLIDSPR